MNRRRFATFLGTSIAGGAIMHQLAPSAAAAEPQTIEYAGADLTGWQTVLGDGLWAAPGQAAVNTADITTNHQGSQSTLRANVQQRGVMAHNITYKSITNTQALAAVHTIGYKFRLPYIPLTWGSTENAQTWEGGFFIWDGGNTRRDYGLAFQWILNPWMSTFGSIRCWTSNATSQWWAPSGYLAPDLAWHTLEMTFNYTSHSTSLAIDGVTFPSAFTETPKPSNWGTETAARFQGEIISLWPGNVATAPAHRVEVKDWHWTWQTQ